MDHLKKYRKNERIIYQKIGQIARQDQDIQSNSQRTSITSNMLSTTSSFSTTWSFRTNKDVDGLSSGRESEICNPE